MFYNLLKILIFCTLCFKASQKNDQEYIYWGNSNILKWDNFHGAIPFGSILDAKSYCGFNFDYELKNDSLTIHGGAYFNKMKSWKKKEASESDYLLNHEQRHFDIAEIHSRYFIKGLTESKPYKNYDIHYVVDSLFKLNKQKMKNMNYYFDKETEHSKNKEIQSKWDKKIDSLLNVTSDYRISQPSGSFARE